MGYPYVYNYNYFPRPADAVHRAGENPHMKEKKNRIKTKIKKKACIVKKMFFSHQTMAIGRKQKPPSHRFKKKKSYNYYLFFFVNLSQTVSEHNITSRCTKYIFYYDIVVITR